LSKCLIKGPFPIGSVEVCLRLKRFTYQSPNHDAPSNFVPSENSDARDGSILRTVLEARTYMLALSKDREHRRQWQRAAELLLAEADVAAFSKAVELALFYDAKLDLAK
jgi:hypothetical protein